MLTIYTYKSCDSCRKAVKWLRAQEIAFDEKPIRETPPSEAEIRQVHAAVGDWGKLFNRSGQHYRALGLKDKLPTIDDNAKVALLASNGNLIKRPFVVLPEGGGLVGFKEDVWTEAFKK